MRRWFIALLVLAASVPAWAARPRPSPPASWPVAGPERLADIAARISGRRAIIVHPPGDAAVPAGALPALAAAWSTPDRPLEVLKAGGTSVLAPAYRDEVNVDFDGLDPAAGLGRAGLWIVAMSSLTEPDVAALGAENGVALSSLAPEARDFLLRALRPPLSVAQADGSALRVEGPLDPAAVRVRARLRSAAPALVAGFGGRSTSIPIEPLNVPDPAKGPHLAPAGGDQTFMAGVSLPVLQRVSNTPKPSDLSVASHTRPIGISGSHPLATVLYHAEQATGLRLLASAQYAALPVVIGSADIPAGEVLDGLCLALTASWRKVGDEHLLTWDRRGLGALQERAAERGSRLSGEATTILDKAAAAPNWFRFATMLPFADDNASALTQEQRAFAYGDEPPPSGWSGFPFEEMTPGQQEAIRKGVVGNVVAIPALDGATQIRKARESDLSLVRLSGTVVVDFEVRFPGGGWARVPRAWQRRLSPSDVRSMRSRYGQPPPPPAPPERPHITPRMPQPAQITLSPARRRGIMVPVLAASVLKPLADVMAAREIGTLYYPLLTDGKATVSSRAFPAHAAIAAGAGYEDVRNLMAARGVPVVGYIETLAWRKPGETGHWLNEHPDWLDRDVLDRAFSDAIAGQFHLPDHAAGLVIGDLVRSEVPDVAERLETLLREHAALPGSSGVLFDAWSGETALSRRGYPERDYRPRWPLTRGFALPVRLERVRRESVDPVDISDEWNGTLRPRDALAAPDAASGYGFGTNAADRALLRRLAAVRPAGNGAWRTSAIVEGRPYGGDAGGSVEPAPEDLPVDVAITNADQWQLRKDLSDALFRVKTPGPDERGGATDFSTPVIAMVEANRAWTRPEKPLDLAIYDFRLAPGELLDSLRRVGLPPPVEDGAW